MEAKALQEAGRQRLANLQSAADVLRQAGYGSRNARHDQLMKSVTLALESGLSADTLQGVLTRAKGGQSERMRSIVEAGETMRLSGMDETTVGQMMTDFTERNMRRTEVMRASRFAVQQHRPIWRGRASGNSSGTGPGTGGRWGRGANTPGASVRVRVQVGQPIGEADRRASGAQSGPGGPSRRRKCACRRRGRWAGGGGTAVPADQAVTRGTPRRRPVRRARRRTRAISMTRQTVRSAIGILAIMLPGFPAAASDVFVSPRLETQAGYENNRLEESGSGEGSPFWQASSGTRCDGVRREDGDIAVLRLPANAIYEERFRIQGRSFGLRSMAVFRGTE